jgi:hypothetical protein
MKPVQTASHARLIRASRPYPSPFSETEQRIIEAAIRIGLGRLLAAREFNLKGVGEKKLNQALVDELSRMLDESPAPVQGFQSTTFETVARGQEMVNYNGRQLEKRPDIVFRRCGRAPEGIERQHHALFVECKIIDPKRTMSYYCLQGVDRFRCGQYAWSVSTGMMVAYVRDNYRLPDTLRDYLLHPKFGRRHRTMSGPDLRDQPPAPDVWVTVHHRRWKYSEGHSPGTITLHHIWLPVP